MLTTKPDISIEVIREAEFGRVGKVIHCNHAGLSPWPERTVAAVRAIAQQNLTADVSLHHYQQWGEKIEELRENIRKLINARSAGEIALLKNTSEGLSIVARGVNWQAGDNVVYAAQEFPSNRLMWDATGQDFGVEVRVANLEQDGPDCEAALIRKMDRRTRLLSVSSIQYGNGRRMDLKQLKDACLAHGALLCVDAVQSVGASPFDVQECGADFACAGGHKWLLAPEGVGFFYCATEHLHALKLQQHGWHMSENPLLFEAADWEAAKSARRFECGSMNNLGYLALEKSLGLLLETGIERVYQAVEDNISYLMEHLDKKKFALFTDENPEKRGGILSVAPRDGATKRIYFTLMREEIVCALRAGNLRLSPHFYTQKSELDRVIAIANAA